VLRFPRKWWDPSLTPKYHWWGVSVSRQFREDIRDLPEVDLPDWDLIRGLCELFAANAAGAPVQIMGTDRRGTFEATDLGSFQKEAETREVALDTIVLDVFAPERADNGPSRRMRVQISDLSPLLGSWAKGPGAMAEVWSVDEVFARGLAQRIRDLFAAAGQRKAERVAAERRAEQPATTELAPAPKPPWYRRLLADHLVAGVVAVVATVIGGLILAAILA
jgi:hypothetical protein